MIWYHFDQSAVRLCRIVLVFLSAVAPCETYSLGSRMIKVLISRIMCSQLERADHLPAKSCMRGTVTQLGLGSKVSFPKTSDEKQDKYQAAVVQKNLN